MKHYQIYITTLSLCTVIAAFVLAESSSSRWFESQTFRKTEPNILDRYVGNKVCTCDLWYCASTPMWETCSWTESEGCSGCNGLSSILLEYGSKEECYKDGKEDTWGCCHNECSDLGCPSTCPSRWYRKIGKCNVPQNASMCNVEICYEF